MKKCNFLVIGGLGFIGKATVRILAANGHKVRVFDRRIPEKEEACSLFNNLSNIEFIAGDFINKKHLHDALEGCDVCIHLATTTLPATSNDDKIFDAQTNLVGTILLLEILRELNINKMVFLSSGGTVYGNPLYTPIDENHPTNPATSYGIIKLSIEKYCTLFNLLYGMKNVVIRLSNPYGLEQSGNGIQGVISVFLKKALSDEPIDIWGDGSVVRDYIYIEDVAKAILSASIYEGNETVFNIGSGVGTSINDIVAYLKEGLDKPLSVNYNEARCFDAKINILDIQKAKSELNWSPSIDVKTGLQSMISVLKNRKV